MTLSRTVIQSQRLSSLRTSQWRSQSKARTKLVKGASWHSAKATNLWVRRWPIWSPNWPTSVIRNNTRPRKCLLLRSSYKNKSRRSLRSSHNNNSLRASYPNAAIRNGKNWCSQSSMQVHSLSIQEQAHLSHIKFHNRRNRCFTRTYRRTGELIRIWGRQMLTTASMLRSKL